MKVFNSFIGLTLLSILLALFLVSPSSSTKKGKGFKIVQLSLGGLHSAALSKNGDVFTWGFNFYGQLGLGDNTNRLMPYQIPDSSFNHEKIIQVSAGTYHTGALTKYGKVYTWGLNIFGGLGLNDTVNRNVPVQIPPSYFNNERIVYIDMGFFSSAAVAASGNVYMWGWNNLGQLGLGDTINRLVPNQIPRVRFNNLNVKRVSLGDFHAAALTQNGRVYTWGANGSGQLGLGDTTQRLIPTQIPQIRFNNEEVKKISLGNSFSMALTREGNVYVWGNNNLGKLGLGDNINRNIPTLVPLSAFNNVRIKDISAGFSFSMVLTRYGRVYTAGANSSGQLGIGNNALAFRNTFGEVPPSFFNFHKVISVEAGDFHAGVLTKYHNVYVWGNNVYGQLGLNDQTNRFAPTRLPYVVVAL